MSFKIQSNAQNILAKNRQACLEAVGSTVEAAAEDARNRCPVKTGNLRDSIDSGVQSSESVVTAYFGASADYAPTVELGTARQSPKPFIRPAAENMPERLVEELRGRLG